MLSGYTISDVYELNQIVAKSYTEVDFLYKFLIGLSNPERINPYVRNMTSKKWGHITAKCDVIVARNTYVAGRRLVSR